MHKVMRYKKPMFGRSVSVPYNQILSTYRMDVKSRLCKLCILVLCVSSVSSSNCDSKTDCVSCTSKSSWLLNIKCRWCPLDRKCHAYASAANPCRTRQNLKDPSNCYSKTIGTYNPDSAYVNTLLTAVAYSNNPEKCLNTIRPNSGIKLVDLIGRKCDQNTKFNYEHCFAYTAISDSQKFIVVAFKGTANSLAQLWDEARNVLLQPKTPFIIGGMVQVYFKDVFDLFYSCVKESIRQMVISNPEYDIVVTGHSLGGAIQCSVSSSCSPDL